MASSRIASRCSKSLIELAITGEKLEEVKKYIDENGKRPSNYEKNSNIKTKRLGGWIIEQQLKYKKK